MTKLLQLINTNGNTFAVDPNRVESVYWDDDDSEIAIDMQSGTTFDVAGEMDELDAVIANVDSAREPMAVKVELARG